MSPRSVGQYHDPFRVSLNLDLIQRLALKAHFLMLATDILKLGAHFKAIDWSVLTALKCARCKLLFRFFSTRHQRIFLLSYQSTLHCEKMLQDCWTQALLKRALIDRSSQILLGNTKSKWKSIMRSSAYARPSSLRTNTEPSVSSLFNW